MKNSMGFTGVISGLSECRTSSLVRCGIEIDNKRTAEFIDLLKRSGNTGVDTSLSLVDQFLSLGFNSAGEKINRPTIK